MCNVMLSFNQETNLKYKELLLCEKRSIIYDLKIHKSKLIRNIIGCFFFWKKLTNNYTFIFSNYTKEKLV